MELPTAADFKDIPTPPPGMAISAFPHAREYMWDPFWWNQIGRDMLSQRHIFDRYTGEEQKKMLGELLEEYPGKGGRIIETAIDAGEAGVVQSMLELGVEIDREKGLIKGRSNLPSTKEDRKEIDMDEEYLGEEEQFYPLHSACFQKQSACAKILVEKGGINVNSVDDVNTTPLTNAARAGDMESAKFLLNYGADPTYTREKGLSIFECAATSGNVDVLRIIADHEKSVEAGNKVGMELFISAAESGNAKMMKFILERAGLLVDEKERVGTLNLEQKKLFTENLWRVVRKESLESLDLLLSFLTPRDAEGNFEYYQITPHEDQVRVFNSSEDAIKNTAIFQRAWEVLLAPPMSILENDAEAKALYYDWLHRRLHSAAGDGALETLKLIMDKYKPDVNHISHKYHMTALFAAAAQGAVDVVRTLVEDYHADIHLGSGTYANGPTALHNAVRERRKEVVEVLLRFGGPVDELDNLAGLVESTNQNKKVVAAFEKYRAPVMVYSEAQFEAVENGNDKFSKIIIDFEEEGGDIGSWIGSLQVRKRDERLKEEGEGARPLMKESEIGGENAHSDKHAPKKQRHMAWLEQNGLAPR